jgi:5-methyltetrahydrofolate--homocysteine methyltransferase
MSLLGSLASGERLLMDGGTGGHLVAAGFSCPERACLGDPDRVRRLHEGYVRAGARVLLTNTFQLNPAALARHGLEAHLETIGRRAVALARLAGPRAWVLGDVGPLCTPGGAQEFTDKDALRRTLAALEGADGVLFETCSSPAALAAVAFALHRAPEVETLPLLLSLSYHRNAAGALTTFSGHPPETFARHAARHGVAALGVNCGKEIGLAEAAEVLRRYRDCTDLPLFARPNAGTPDGRLRYPLSPDQLAAGAADLLAAGASMLGGCCGTTADHIAALGRCV